MTAKPKRLILVWYRDENTLFSFSSFQDEPYRQFLFAGTLQEARKYFQLPISLLIIEFKDSDQSQIFQELQHYNRNNVPILALVDEHNDLQRLETLALGARDFLVKTSNSEVQLAKIETHLHYSELLRQLEQQNKLLERLAAVDELTQLYNRRSLTRALSLELDKAAQAGYSLGLLLIDLDHFKQINDIYGHQAGDDILVQFSELMKNLFRITDIVARYGGEEFCVVIPKVGIERLISCAETLLKSVEHFQFEYDSLQVCCTVSIGVAFLPSGKGASIRRLLRCADAGLYEAKRLGRNRIGIRNLGDWEASPGCGRVAVK